jgi:16S rRNA (cytosine1402-N4)-methyltransferase
LLFGCDRDGDAVEAARARLARFAGRFEIRQGSFEGLAEWVEPESCDGVLLDLGVSSPQLDRPERGFSFQRDGPLDMRMDPTRGTTALELVNDRDVDELARWFWDLGGERAARRIARAIGRERERVRLQTTRQLAALVERVAPRGGGRTHPATGVFQALRMVVNDEAGSLERGLAAVWRTLKRGGRLSVITFHSLEDRLVKEFGRRMERDYTVSGVVDVPELRVPIEPRLRRVWRKAIKPGPAEQSLNPRARSAQLRVFEKL